MLFPRDHLVAALHQRGICYLAPSPQGDEPHFTDDELIVGLAASRDGRLRFALAGWLLVDPSLASRVSELLQTRALRRRHGAEPKLAIPDAAWAEVQRQYLAAMYLQRMWRTRLRLAHGPTPLIADPFSQNLGLPAADAMFGEYGLRAMTDGSIYNDWSSYQQVIDMICEQPCKA